MTLRRLVDFYPQHIEKENMRFFYPCTEYFNEEELEHMVEEFQRYDADMIHVKYIDTIEYLMQTRGR